jgi:serine protease
MVSASFSRMRRVVFTPVVIALFGLAPENGLTAPAAHRPHFLDVISTPQKLSIKAGQKPIVIAIVDDGVRITHQDLRSFIWTNPGEIPHNNLDDDGNGFVDDIHGWDVSDDDNTVEPPADRPEFYHGTHLAGIVAQVAQHAYGEAASKTIKIMSVKSLGDVAETRYLKQAYKGIDYAIDAGADIILCSWNLATISEEESRTLRRAEEAGVLIIASAGNFPEERLQFPAAAPQVIAVTSSNNAGRKSSSANFGAFIDLAAPGEAIEAAGGIADDAYQTLDGTSGAAAVVAAAAAVVKAQHPLFSAQEVKACLMSSAKPITPYREIERGKLGAGLVDIAAAVDCTLLMAGKAGDNHLSLPKAYLRPARDVLDPVTWMIAPEGEIKGIWFTRAFNRNNTDDGTLQFRSGNTPGARLIASYSLPKLPDKFYVPGTEALVRYLPNKGSEHNWLMGYEVDAIDVRSRYCKGTTRLATEGVLTDGSGDKNYSYSTDCKWLITAPAGKVIQFSFSHLDTESRVDMVYFFNGAGTHEDIMSISSGQVLPPTLTSWSNQVLVWFVANGENQGQGWRTEYSFVDPPEP